MTMDYVDIRETFAPRVWHNSPDKPAREVTDANDPVLSALPAGDTLTMVVDWRARVPLRQKLNPVWLLGNDWDRDVPDWYMPGRASWLREVLWWLRNPAENAKRVLVGVGDLNYTVVIDQRDEICDGDLHGWETGKLVFADGMTLPWTSMGARGGRFYWGWQPVGVGAIKMNGWAWLLLPYMALWALPKMTLRIRAALRGYI